jgi:hypothetical protein
VTIVSRPGASAASDREIDLASNRAATGRARLKEVEEEVAAAAGQVGLALLAPSSAAW